MASPRRRYSGRRNSHLIHQWLSEHGYTLHKIAKLLHISQINVRQAMSEPQKWLSLSDLRVISSACQRPLIDVICAVLRDDVAEEVLRKKVDEEGLSWFEKD